MREASSIKVVEYLEVKGEEQFAVSSLLEKMKDYLGDDDESLASLI